MSKLKTLTPYILSAASCLEKIENTHVLFDTDAIIAILKFEALELFNEFKKAKVTNCIIHPVKMELLCTDNEVDRATRQSILDSYDFFELPFRPDVFQKAEKLVRMMMRQSKKSGGTRKGFSASPIDLYQGAVLSSYSQGKISLLTGDAKDFPYPIYDRISHFILQNHTNRRILSFLQLEKTAYEQLNSK